MVDETEAVMPQAVLEGGRLEPGIRRAGHLSAEQEIHFIVDVPGGHWMSAVLHVEPHSDPQLRLETAEGVVLRVNEGWSGIPERLALAAAPDRRQFRLVVAPAQAQAAHFEVDVAFEASPTSVMRARAEAQRLYQEAQTLPPDSELRRDDATDPREGLRHVAEIWESIDHRHQAATAWEELSKYLTQGRRRSEAIRALSHAIRLRQSLEHEVLEGAALNRRGLLFREEGRGEDAREDLERALALFIEAGDARRRAASINNLALLQQDRGELMAAQQSYEKALNVLGAVSDPGPMLDGQAANMLDNLARLEMIQGRLGPARRLLDRSLERRLRSGNSLGIAATRAELAWLHTLQEDGQSALRQLELARAALNGASEELSMRLEERRGAALGVLGRLQAARQAYRRAAELARDLGDRDYVAGILLNLCRLSLQSPPESSDPAPCARSLDALEQIGDPNRLSSAHYWRGRELERAQRPVEAMAAYETSADLVDSLYHRVAGRDSRSTFFEDRSAPLKRWIDLAMQLYRENPQAGHEITALEASERLRANGVRNLLRTAGVDWLDTAEGDLKQEYEDLSGRIGQLDFARRSIHDTEDRAALDRQLEKALDRLDVLEQQLRESCPSFREIQPQEPRQVTEFQRQLDEKTIFVSLLTSEPESYLWIVGRTKVEAHFLPGAEELERRSRRFVAALRDSNPYAAWSLGRRLSTSLFGPSESLLRGLEGHRLVFIGDGSLQQLPLAALPLAASDVGRPRFLLETYEIVHVPSMSSLTAQRELERQRLPYSIAVVADPLYELNSFPRLEKVPEHRLAEYFPGDLPATGVGRLKYADLEAKKVAQHFQKTTRLVATGLDASRELPLSGRLGDFAILHFVSHGRFDARHPELSALALSEFDSSGRRVDGWLRLRDLYRSKLRAELAVTSACDTAVGRDFRFEGVAGLSRGLVHAGVARTISSLWQVDSESTAHLMDEFYLQLQTHGRPPGEALRLAQLSLLESPQNSGRAWNSPHYWAAFVMMGDWQRFEVSTQEQQPANH